MNAIAEISIALIEPSFAHMIVRIEADGTLPKAKKVHWRCSVSIIAKGLQKDLASIPARWTAIRLAVGDLHHERMGVAAKTLASHRANLKAALRWFSGAADLPKRGVPLNAEWAPLAVQVGERVHRAPLLALMRFCSARGTAPSDVNEEVIDAFKAYRIEHTRLLFGLGERRALARAWNACINCVVGWPDLRLVEPVVKTTGMSLESLPEGLRIDIETHLEGLTHIRRNHRGKRLRPAKASTIGTRRRELMGFVAKAVECGFPLERLTSMRELLQPDVVEPVLDAYWKENGETPKVYTIDLAWKALSLARHFGLDEAALEQLEDLRANLEEYRRPGLTPKNRAVIRQVLVDEVWRKVIALPEKLMAEAARQHNQRPVRAAVLAAIAVAIAILVFAPVRVGNLASIRIGDNLIRPGGDSGPWWLVFPDYEVKNRVPLEYELNGRTTELIDRYIAQFRPALQRGSREQWLFPGEDGNSHKGAATLSGQITDRVYAATGLRLTAHQFRHAAAAIFLKHRPGEYELVRRLLGHTSITTTMSFYAGLESIEANRLFGEIVASKLRERLEDGPKAKGGKGGPSSKASTAPREVRP
jgi:integrase